MKTPVICLVAMVAFVGGLLVGGLLPRHSPGAVVTGANVTVATGLSSQQACTIANAYLRIDDGSPSLHGFRKPMTGPDRPCKNFDLSADERSAETCINVENIATTLFDPARPLNEWTKVHLKKFPEEGWKVIAEADWRSCRP